MKAILSYYSLILLPFSHTPTLPQKRSSQKLSSLPALPESADGGQHDCIDCGITERQRCECRVALAAAGGEAVYICDPDDEFNFLVCTNDGRVVCQVKRKTGQSA